MEQTVLKQMQVQEVQVQEVQVSQQTFNAAEQQQPQQQNNVVEPPPAPTIESQFNSLLQDLSCFKLQLHDIQGKVKLLEKTITKELKSKGKQEKKQTTLKLQLPSGFDKPSSISDEMCLFLGKPIGSTMSLTELTQFMTNYIRDNKCQDMTERKNIKPDEVLRKLLKLKTPDEQVTYFNLQKYLSIHFI
jgi:chromatin remodeling complex protein RSC6